ncbi:MAG: DNA polymerase IV [Actinomycetota bacterium]
MSEPASPPVLAHVDMDAFFASVEVLDHPEWQGREILVGGSGARGVVASCSYAARQRGVHNAMAMGKARGLCKEPVIVSPRIARYSEISHEVMATLADFSAGVEALGMDEAYLDLGGVRLEGRSLSQLGKAIRAAVKARTGLNCSMGIARTRVMAKLASKAAKPLPGSTQEGVRVIGHDEELSFLAPMDLRELPGVGAVLAKRLASLGFSRVEQIQDLEVSVLSAALGLETASRLIAMATAQDSSLVNLERKSKSVGHEQTFAEDITDRAKALRELFAMADNLSAHSLGRTAAKTLTLKVKFDDFRSITRSASRDQAWRGSKELRQGAEDLLAKVPEGQAIRLLGLSLSNFEEDLGEQLSLIDGDQGRREDWRLLAETVEEVRERFGKSSLGPLKADS